MSNKPTNGYHNGPRGDGQISNQGGSTATVAAPQRLSRPVSSTSSLSSTNQVSITS